MRSSRKLAVGDLFKQLDGPLQHEVAAQQRAAEPTAGALDLLGRGDFVVPVEHRDLAHLHQVHAHGIVDGRLVVAIVRLLLGNLLVAGLHIGVVERRLDVGVSSSTVGRFGFFGASS